VKDGSRAVLGEGWTEGVKLCVDERAALADALRVEARPDQVGSAQGDDRLVACEKGLDDRAADQALRAGY
jgi:hypothetical protein